MESNIIYDDHLHFLGKSYKYLTMIRLYDELIPLEAYVEYMRKYKVEINQDVINYLNQDDIETLEKDDVPPEKYRMHVLSEDFMFGIYFQERIDDGTILKTFWEYDDIKHNRVVNIKRNNTTDNKKLYILRLKYCSKNEILGSEPDIDIKQILIENPDMSVYDIARIENETLNGRRDCNIIRGEDGKLYVDYTWRTSLTDEYIQSVIDRYLQFEKDYLNEHK